MTAECVTSDRASIAQSGGGGPRGRGSSLSWGLGQRAGLGGLLLGPQTPLVLLALKCSVETKLLMGFRLEEG